MNKKTSPDDSELSESTIIEKRDAALLRALSTPHKRQKDMKLGDAKQRKSPNLPVRKPRNTA
jgi:hypothetical protein